MSSPVLARRALLAATLVASLGPSATGQVAVPCASQVLEPDGLGAQDQLGSAVALEAGTLVVGAPLDDGAGTSAGTLFAWKRTDAGTFELVGELAPDALAAGDQLGRAVAASGNRVLAGAPLAEVGAAEAAGAAHLFELGPPWVAVGALEAADAASGDGFGSAVAIDDDTAIVGAPADDDGAVGAGSAYVFRRDASGAWQQVAKLTAAAPGAGDAFGSTVAVDGTWVAVGAPGTDLLFGTDHGRVHLFEEVAGGYVPRGTLTAAFEFGSHRFGAALSLHGDRLAVGAPGDYVLGIESGSVFVYRRDGAGVWSVEQKLLAWDGTWGDTFGSSVALRGERLIAGAPARDGEGPDAGAAYLFVRDGPAWTGLWKLEPHALAAGDQFGAAVGLDDAALAGGAPRTNGAAGSDEGLAYAFDVAPLPPLLGCPPEVSLSDGGEQRYFVEFGPAHFNHVYLLLGSAGGTAPGFSVDGVHVPLVLDAYTALTVAQKNQVPWIDTYGVLDGQGHAEPRLQIGAGAEPALAGVVLHHAAVAIDFFGGIVVVAATNPVAVTLAP